MKLGSEGEVICLAGDERERLKPQVIEALKELMAKRQREDGSFWAPSSAWFIAE